MSQVIRPTALIRWAASEGLTLGGLFGFGYGIVYLLLTVFWLTIPMLLDRGSFSDASVIVSVVFFGLPIVVFGSICGALVGLLCGAILGMILTLFATRHQQPSTIYMLTTTATAFIVLTILRLSNGWSDYMFRVFPGILMLLAGWILTSRFFRRAHMEANES